MDCGLIVDDAGDPARVYTLPMSDVQRRHAGRAAAPPASGSTPRRSVATAATVFGFMESDVS